MTRTPCGREHGDVAVGEEENVARVVENRGNVAGDEVFVFAQADHRRRARARGDDFVGVVARKESPGRKRP